MQAIELTAKEVLLELVKENRDSLPFSLKAKDLIKLMNCSRTQAYTALENGTIPGAKKIEGLGWRINREIFLTWLCSQEVEN
ncbi:MAG: helix-turn-helix domain-containing protein [Candidatus Woesearchaeota archaeon]